MKIMYGLDRDSFLNARAKKTHRRGITVIIMSDFCRGRERDERIGRSIRFQEDWAIRKR